MNITIVSSVGHGSTLLSAFDDALLNAGIHNYNLITLSSVIPPHTTIVQQKKYKASSDEFGSRLYVVRAEIRGEKKGFQLASGIGWYQLEDGRGFFVEHETIGKSEKEVTDWIESQIMLSLKDLVMHRDLVFDKKKVSMKVTYAAVPGKPTSVLTAAVYKSEGWK